jgi:hypothetical protein
MAPVLLRSKPPTGPLAKLGGSEELSEVVVVCVEPAAGFLFIMGKEPDEVFDLHDLPKEGHRYVPVVSPQEFDGAGSKVRPDLGRDSETNDAVVPIPPPRSTCRAILSDDRAGHQHEPPEVG